MRRKQKTLWFAVPAAAALLAALLLAGCPTGGTGGEEEGSNVPRLAADAAYGWTPGSAPAITPLSVPETAGASYQWYINGRHNNAGGRKIPGATAASYTPPNTDPFTAYYYCVTSKDGTDTASGTAKVSITVLGYTFVPVQGGIVRKNTEKTNPESRGDGPFVHAAQSPVFVDPFCIGETEVTYRLWYAVLQYGLAHDYKFVILGEESPDGNTGEPTEGRNFLVAMPRYRDRIAWCNAFSEYMGKEPVYRDSAGTVLKDAVAPGIETKIDLAKKEQYNGYRIPWEREWEFAARGGDPSSPVWDYPWAGSQNKPEDVAWYNATMVTATENHLGPQEPKGKKPNALGLYDMSGNQWEYCDDRDETAQNLFVVRGGSFEFNSTHAKIETRGSHDPGHAWDWAIGLRPVCNWPDENDE
jgi:formylglycine-generating enzyme required for sulfatase activity